MKIKLFLLLSVLFAACSNDMELDEANIDAVKEITVSAEDFKVEKSARTTVDITSEGVNFKWADKDTIGIFPTEGAQVYFPMEKGAGSSQATFTGGGWTLKASQRYGAYYPFIGSYYIKYDALPVNYLGQVQKGNNTTAHIGAYDYMAAKQQVPENGRANFNFEHMGCLVRFAIPFEQQVDLDYVEFKSAAKVLVVDGTIDLSADKIQITTGKTADTFRVKLEDVKADLPYNNKYWAVVYCMVSPANLSTIALSADVALKDGSVKNYKLKSKDFLAGYAYNMDIEK